MNATGYTTTEELGAHALGVTGPVYLTGSSAVSLVSYIGQGTLKTETLPHTPIVSHFRRHSTTFPGSAIRSVRPPWRLPRNHSSVYVSPPSPML